MNLSTMIFTPISGAVIGYFTNWLAIKMLFRPHREIRICGIKMPFTPGLIPKERYRLADKVSDVISAHLLTKDALTEGFTSDEVTEKIIKLIEKLFSDFSDDTRTIGEYVKASERATEVLHSVEKEASSLILKWLQDEENQKKAAKFIMEKLVGDKAVKIPEAYLETFKGYVGEKLLQWTHSEDFEILFTEKADGLFEKLHSEERSLREILSADWVISVKRIIGESAPSIAEFICSLPENNPALDAALRGTLHKVIDDNMGKIASLFINKDKVYENIKESLFEYLRNAENQADLVFKITGAMEKALDTPVMSLAGKIPESFKEQTVNKVIRFLKYEISGDFYEKVWESIETGLLKSSKIDSGLAEHIEGFVAEIINRWVLENGVDFAEKIPSLAAEKLLEIEIGAYLRKMPPEKIQRVVSAVVDIIKTLIKKGAVFAAEAIDVGKLTKDQINAMDLEQAEEILLSVVKKELNAITNFGGILGFIIGLLPVLLDFFAR